MSSTLALSSASPMATATAAVCVESNILSSCCYIPVPLAPRLNNNNKCFSAALNTNSSTIIRRRRRSMVWCEVALRSNNSATIITEGEEEEVKKKIGARVRVKVPLKVYHVPRIPEVDLTGMEGHLKQYVGIWKGKRISANLPFKVEFVIHLHDRGPVKFFAHLKEDEFEYLDS